MSGTIKNVTNYLRSIVQEDKKTPPPPPQLPLFPSLKIGHKRGLAFGRRLQDDHIEPNQSVSFFHAILQHVKIEKSPKKSLNLAQKAIQHAYAANDLKLDAKTIQHYAVQVIEQTSDACGVLWLRNPMDLQLSDEFTLKDWFHYIDAIFYLRQWNSLSHPFALETRYFHVGLMQTLGSDCFWPQMAFKVATELCKRPEYSDCATYFLMDVAKHGDEKERASARQFLQALSPFSVAAGIVQCGLEEDAKTSIDSKTPQQHPYVLADRIATCQNEIEALLLLGAFRGLDIDNSLKIELLSNIALGTIFKSVGLQILEMAKKLQNTEDTCTLCIYIASQDCVIVNEALEELEKHTSTNAMAKLIVEGQRVAVSPLTKEQALENLAEKTHTLVTNPSSILQNLRPLKDNASRQNILALSTLLQCDDWKLRDLACLILVNINHHDAISCFQDTLLSPCDPIIKARARGFLSAFALQNSKNGEIVLGTNYAMQSLHLAWRNDVGGPTLSSRRPEYQYLFGKDFENQMPKPLRELIFSYCFKPEPNAIFGFDRRRLQKFFP